MLHITVPANTLWDEVNNEFIYVKEQTLVLEHSLVSVSKWESKWCKPFLSKQEKTREETTDYVRCMTITQNVNPEVYKCLTSENMLRINEYIDSPMTATWFSKEESRRSSSEQVTSEIIYYRMISNNIPFECQKWHLNKLLTLIRVCNVKNRPPKKMSRKEILSRNAALNAARRKRMRSNG